MNKHIAPSRKASFTELDAIPATLSAEVAASLLAAVGDVTFILSGSGRILDVAVSLRDLANHGFTDWIGDDWIETVTAESPAQGDRYAGGGKNDRVAALAPA